MQTAPTRWDRMYATVSLYILEMDKTAQVNLMYFVQYYKSAPQRTGKEQRLLHGNQHC